MFNLPKFGEGICLSRLAALLDALSIDRVRLQRHSVVVTGSNGKGSAAAFCASIGTACGLRTGLFTSPHLYRFNERFQIDGVQIGDEALADMVLRVATAIADLAKHGLTNTFGAFEAQFALACLYFQESDCEFAVFEAGIGGRYDPVRLVGALNTCVTSIDYEHVNLLGHSLELIASDKSDACAAGGTIVYGENCRPLQRHLGEYLRHRDVASLFVRDRIAIDNEAMSVTGQRFDFQLGEHHIDGLEMSVPGDFQFNNAAIAAALFLLWSKRTHPSRANEALEAAVRAGIRATRWPGRLEIIQKEPLTIVDVGHTPDGVSQALKSLRAIHGDEGWLLVLGVSGDKNVDGIARHLAPSFDNIVCTSAHHKGADARIVGAAARKANAGAKIHVANTMEAAVRISQQQAKTSNWKVYVAGGLFVAIEYATVLRGGRAQDLQFF
ncbi:MAG: bifunctional folylpolyglutamate synthase/dihydrofolate synthase [Tardiphaga sp.]|uniref:bifunctional folylpolyglutamate synthase/dihydrofolate synthase n=1 Tax=Tardiphaga sp. TaxID=1926292 RepID=UPI002612349A|nr:cyanophycin synthetase [Tardiphaga sp.]MDB5502398.1 bifunctional folylpolyglutamate synthase/dihydrofolate synthase [Tardiphaga sp.]